VGWSLPDGIGINSKVGNEVAIGRTRQHLVLTSISSPSRSCQKWDDGYYSAHRRMAEEDLDMVFFLGDYILRERHRRYVCAQRALPEQFREGNARAVPLSVRPVQD